jgi:hypothetical protein
MISSLYGGRIAEEMALVGSIPVLALMLLGEH